MPVRSKWKIGGGSKGLAASPSPLQAKNTLIFGGEFQLTPLLRTPAPPPLSLRKYLFWIRLALSPYKHYRVTLRILPERQFHFNEISIYFIQGEEGGGRSPAVCMNQHTYYQCVGTHTATECRHTHCYYRV